MFFEYKELKSEGFLRFSRNHLSAMTSSYTNSGTSILRIAYNTSKAQCISIDGIQYKFPSQAIIPLVHDNHFEFAKEEDILLWEFNKEFYCIIDHDKEVSCSGFLFYGAHRPMIINLDQNQKIRLEALSNTFEDEFKEKDNIQGEMLRMLLKRLIILCTRFGKLQYLDNNTGNTEYDLLRKFNVLVEGHFKRLHQVQDYAKLLNKAPKTLSNVFSKLGSETPIQIITNRIVLEAKRMFMYTDQSAKEVAFALGYSDASSFSKVFKKNTGVSPVEYRNQSKKS